MLSRHRKSLQLIWPSPRVYAQEQKRYSTSRARLSMISESAMTHPIPVLLLKTRSQPEDTYEEHFSTGISPDQERSSRYAFQPHFVPVLEHTQNASTLSRLENDLRTGELKRKYGGMIFTSQRAVEAWSDVVQTVQMDAPSQSRSRTTDPDPFADLEVLTPFPLYVVGPATERALHTLTTQCKAVPRSPFTRLNPSVHGAHTGNGAALAAYMLDHYNSLHAEHWFTYFEAPRLPFIPLLGMSSQNYGRKRLERDDPRLAKKPLLFLVGEVRRDIIPKTLQEQDVEARRVGVEEVEVYATGVMGSFEVDFKKKCELLDGQVEAVGSGGVKDVRVVVVFSPQGSDAMLRGIKWLDEEGRVTEEARRKWWDQGEGGERGAKWIVVTIGPTTRDYLKDTLGIEPHVCAEKPSPQGLREGIEEFMRNKKITV